MKLWEDFRTAQRYNERMLEKGLPGLQLPIPPLRRRIYWTLGRAIDRRREAIAVRIAPWLDPEEQA